MKEVNGEFYMDGCDADDPKCLNDPEQLLVLLRSIGFLPLFSNAVKGFSVEEYVPAERWWTGGKNDSWEWRHMLAGHSEIAYDKFFAKKAGFIHKDWFPVFACFRRNGYDFDALCDDGLAPHKWKTEMEQFSTDENMSGKLLPASGISSESIKTELQMRTYLIITDLVQKRNKKGQPYGWHLAMLGTPETKWGYDHVTSCYPIGCDGCRAKILEHMKRLYPSVDEKKIKSIIGMRML
ncbi:MAG: hypothetical protein IKH75_08040 [Ruminococcus sp.]|nr:hypothetical protein [Ruminococcus sp.]